MGLLDRLLAPFRRAPPPDPEVDPEPTPAPPVEARPPEAQRPPKPPKPPKPAKTPKAPKAKRAGKKERSDPPPPAPARDPGVEVLSVDEAERRYRALLDAEVNRPRPAPVEAREPAVEEVVPPPRTERERPRAPRRTTPAVQFERLLSRADALLAVPAADPGHLASARRELLRDWARLGPPAEEDADRLAAARASRLAAFDERASAALAAREVVEKENLAQKLAIVEEARALSESGDLAGAGPAMGRLRTRLRAVGPVPRDDLARVDAAFSEAEARLRARQAERREGREAARKEQLDKLDKLVLQAESLGRSRDPEAAAERVKELQVAWKEVRVPGPRAEVDQAWSRFRAACDLVFARRTEARAEGARVAVERLEKVVLQAEALAASEPEGDVDEAIRKLMGDWKRAGRAPREAQDVLWERLRRAFDALRAPTAPLAGTADDPGLQFRPFEQLKRSE